MKWPGSLRSRKWMTVAILMLLALPAPLLLILGKTAIQHPPRRVLPFDPDIWRDEAGRLDPESARGLMVPGLLRSGRLAGIAEAEVRALLGEPDCPAGPGGPFAGASRLAYWVGKTGTRTPKPDDPAAGPGCLYLHLEGDRVVEWQLAPAAGGGG